MGRRYLSFTCNVAMKDGCKRDPGRGNGPQILFGNEKRGRRQERGQELKKERVKAHRSQLRGKKKGSKFTYKERAGA